MQFELYGLAFESSGLTCHLWSPWRCSALEHRLFELIRALPNTEYETHPDEQQVHITDPDVWRGAVKLVERVLKGWQEEASDGAENERRIWRWMVEADVDAHGFDHHGEKAGIWAFLRLTLERAGNSNDEAERAEELDLNGFGVCLWNED